MKEEDETEDSNSWAYRSYLAYHELRPAYPSLLYCLLCAAVTQGRAEKGSADRKLFPSTRPFREYQNHTVPSWAACSFSTASSLP